MSDPQFLGHVRGEHQAGARLAPAATVGDPAFQHSVRADIGVDFDVAYRARWVRVLDGVGYDLAEP